jgi:hypothetical protein
VTAQVHDVVLLGGAEHALTGIAGSGLFAVAEHGIHPGMLGTGCWRGHYCVYAVRDGRLVLAELRLGHGATLHGTPLAGDEPLLGGTVVAVEPASASWLHEAFALYDLAWPVAFTGTLLAARDLVSSGPHMGYWPAWHYGTVVELVVERGAVTATRDRSAEMAETRRAIEAGERAHPDGERGSPGWVERTFGLGYDRSAPPRPPTP